MYIAEVWFRVENYTDEVVYAVQFSNPKQLFSDQGSYAKWLVRAHARDN